MNYQEYRKNQMFREDQEGFVKALIDTVKNIQDEQALDKSYRSYMDNESQGLLNAVFDEKIEELRELGQIQESKGFDKDRDDLVNLVGNVVGEVELFSRETKEGKPFQVINFSVVSQDNEGVKTYLNCSAYGDKGTIPKNFKQGDFVKLFGQMRTSVDSQGKEY